MSLTETEEKTDVDSDKDEERKRMAEGLEKISRIIKKQNPGLYRK